MLRIFPGQDAVDPRLQRPGRMSFMPYGQGIQLKAQCQFFRFPGLQQLRLSESHKALCFRLQGSVRAGGICLDHLLSAYVAGIPDLYLHRDGRSLQGRPDRRAGKPGIAQPVSEGIPRPDAEAVKVPVSHIDAFRIRFLDQVSVPVGEGRAGGIVLISPGPGIRELSGRVHLPGEHIRYGVSALASRLAHQQDRIRPDLFLEGKINDPADVQQHDNRFPHGAQRLKLGAFPIA